MSFFDPPKFPEPFKPEPLWQMNTCPTCQNALVCHDQGECLRPTPETPIQVIQNGQQRFAAQIEQLLELRSHEVVSSCRILARQLAEARAICEELVTDSNAVTLAATVVRLERERDEAREQLACEKSTRNAIIAKGVETERQLAEVRQKLEIAMAANSDVERIATERNEAQKAFAIATDQLVQVQGELRQAREENARLREALQANLFHHALACVWRHQDGTFDDKVRITEDSCQCPPKTKTFRKLLGTNSENKGFDP